MEREGGQPQRGLGVGEVDGYGVTIRLDDCCFFEVAPLHEFFPHNSGLKQEENPMLGHRSVRMAITNPEIPEMQIKAILDAAAELIKEGKHPKPEIEIPLVIIAPEVKAILEIAVKVAAQVKKEQGFAVPYALGTMVETPAAAISGSEIVPALRAKVAGYDDEVVTSSGNKGAYTPKQEDSSAMIGGFELSMDTHINNQFSLYAAYSFLYSKRDFDVRLSKSEKNDIGQFVPYDAMHRAKLGMSYLTDSLSMDLAWFLVGGSPKSASYMKRPYWQTPFYAIFQPEVTIALPHRLGLMLSGSYTFSEGMTKSPTYHYYYEKEGVPVPRYSVAISLQYPFRGTGR